MRPNFQAEMIRSELEDVVGADYITTRESDRLVYSTDWSWMAQMWLDRGQPLPLADYIVHPAKPTEIAQIIGCRPGTVKSLLDRATKKLRKELQP